MGWQIIIAWMVISILVGIIIGVVIRRADSIKPEEDR